MLRAYPHPPRRSAVLAVILRRAKGVRTGTLRAVQPGRFPTSARGRALRLPDHTRKTKGFLGFFAFRSNKAYPVAGADAGGTPASSAAFGGGRREHWASGHNEQPAEAQP
jgi:hypothetical protein